MKDANFKNQDFYKNKNVLVTGHTGFKGAWLCSVLDYLQSNVTGYALKAERGSLFEKINGAGMVTHVEGDIRNYDFLKKTVDETQPEIVFHLAALAQVKDCFDDPIKAYSTNVMGTVNLLEALKDSPVKSIVIVTTDKVYENKGNGAIYVENDLLGGSDPYATSKTSMEFVAKAYRESYYQNSEKCVGIATVRASNVLAGGDHVRTRLIPSILNAVSEGRELELRNPDQTRPWQSVLDALNGYLTIGRYLYDEPLEYSEGWNIGPTIDGIRSVSWIVKKVKESFAGLESKDGVRFDVKESETLGLDISKALERLDWNPELSCDEVVKSVVEFFSGQQQGISERVLCQKQIEKFYNKGR